MVPSLLSALSTSQNYFHWLQERHFIALSLNVHSHFQSKSCTEKKNLQMFLLFRQLEFYLFCAGKGKTK